MKLLLQKKVKQKRKGEKRKMPKEMMQEFMGKVCSISLFNDSFGMVGKIVAVEDNWIKVENKKEVRILNGDMVQSITLMPEKYQNKD